MAIHFRSAVVNQQLLPTIVDAQTVGYCCNTGIANTTKAQCTGGFIAGATDASGCATSGGCIEQLNSLTSGSCCYWKKDQNILVQQCMDVLWLIKAQQMG
jgi:hypothetical protein